MREREVLNPFDAMLSVDTTQVPIAIAAAHAISIAFLAMLELTSYYTHPCYTYLSLLHLSNRAIPSLCCPSLCCFLVLLLLMLWRLCCCVFHSLLLTPFHGLLCIIHGDHRCSQCEQLISMCMPDTCVRVERDERVEMVDVVVVLHIRGHEPWSMKHRADHGA